MHFPHNNYELSVDGIAKAVESMNYIRFVKRRLCYSYHFNPLTFYTNFSSLQHVDDDHKHGKGGWELCYSTEKVAFFGESEGKP